MESKEKRTKRNHILSFKIKVEKATGERKTRLSKEFDYLLRIYKLTNKLELQGKI